MYTLAVAHCTVDEIAEDQGLTITALTHREEFLEVYKRAFAQGRIKLRRLQWALAESGDRTMLIWLGKQILGQKEVIEHSGPQGGPIEIQSKTDLSKLSTEELLVLQDLMDKAQVIEQRGSAIDVDGVEVE